MPPENDRFFTSQKHRFSRKGNTFLYSSLLGGAALLLSGVYLFSQRYQHLHHNSLEPTKKIVVSLSQSVKPVIPSVSLLPLSPASVPGQLKSKSSMTAKVFARFSLISSDYVLAQIGAAALPEALYHSSESLEALFTPLLSRIPLKTPQTLEDKEDKITPVFLKDAPFYQYAIPFLNSHHLARISTAYPLTIDVAAPWKPSLKQRVIILAPLSAFVKENPS